MRNKSKNGFSLIELSVVIAIIVILSAAIIPRYSTYKKEKSMSYAKTQIMNDVRYVQSFTLSTKKLPDGSSPTGGYGIQFKVGSTYTLFGDRMHGAAVPDHAYNAGSPENELFETVNLVDGITISKITVNGTIVSEVDYVTVPPYGKVFINKTDVPTTLIITFTNGVSAREETVRITSSGFIS